jgi:RNA-binding protein
MEEAPPTPLEPLEGFQRRYLRGLANPIKALVHVGENGISEAVVGALQDALEHHELVKIRLFQPADKQGNAAELAARGQAHLCGVVGHTVILYRPHPEKLRIELPERS